MLSADASHMGGKGILSASPDDGMTVVDILCNAELVVIILEKTVFCDTNFYLKVVCDHDVDDETDAWLDDVGCKARTVFFSDLYT